ncbi:hypothetical protein AAEX28_07635 [Lentisphaerota bacterium WC36G]|nr:hypothetical protein LJT99_10495 [Lentisphaerae bacterium WC36]
MNKFKFILNVVFIVLTVYLTGCCNLNKSHINEKAIVGTLLVQEVDYSTTPINAETLDKEKILYLVEAKIYTIDEKGKSKILAKDSIVMEKLEGTFVSLRNQKCPPSYYGLSKGMINDFEDGVVNTFILGNKEYFNVKSKKSSNKINNIEVITTIIPNGKEKFPPKVFLYFDEIKLNQTMTMFYYLPNGWNIATLKNFYDIEVNIKDDKAIINKSN